MSLNKTKTVLYIVGILLTSCTQEMKIENINAEIVINDPTTANKFFNECTEKYLKNSNAFTKEEFYNCMWYNITDLDQERKEHKVECISCIAYELPGCEITPQDCVEVLPETLIFAAECLRQKDVLTEDSFEICMDRKYNGENSSTENTIYCRYECSKNSLAELSLCIEEGNSTAIECDDTIQENENLCTEECVNTKEEENEDK